MSIISSLPAITQKSQKRLGRGYGSGKGGHTSGRGAKGQLSRRGAKIPLYFEGGNLPLVKRLPMLRGKKRLNIVRPSVELTLSDLESLSVDQVSMDTLKLAGLVPAGVKKVKIIATGSLTKPMTVVGIATSAAAHDRIVKAGGKVL